MDREFSLGTVSFHLCFFIVMSASSDQELQQAVGQFAAKCDASGMRISTSKSEAMVLSLKRGLAPTGLVE